MHKVVRSLIGTALVAVSTGNAIGSRAEEPPSDPVDQCVVCHIDEEVFVPEDFLADNVHLQPGLSCAGCHGGDPTQSDMEAAKAPGTGFIGAPLKADIPLFCGRCHSDITLMRKYQPRIATDQVDQYFTSVHGRRLKEGDQKVADCTSCHMAHGILAANDPRSTVYSLNVPNTCNRCHGDQEYMSDYGIPTHQFDEYAKGVHGQALLEKKDTGAPACNDCHGNHGAMPPGYTSIAQVCGHCHVNNMRYFAETPMAKAFREEELHDCEECHGNHNVQKTRDSMIGVSEGAICLDCHSEGDGGYQAAEAISKQLQELVAVYDVAVAKQEEVHRIGMNDEEIGFVLQEAHQSLIQARTLVHTFDPQQVGPKTHEGLEKVKDAMNLAAAELREYQIRRRGLAMATIFITVLIVGLFLKIREIERV